MTDQPGLREAVLGSGAGGPLTAPTPWIQYTGYLQYPGGVVVGNPTGGNKGNGTINVPALYTTTLYINGVPVNLASYLPLAGGVMTGMLTLNADPIGNFDAATKRYVDNSIATTNANFANYLPLIGGTLTGSLTLSTGAINLPADPAQPLQAATKQYVDAKSGQVITIPDAPSNGSTYGRNNGAWNNVIDAMTANVIKIWRSLTAGARPTGAIATYGVPYVNFADNQFGVLDSGNNPRDLIGVPVFSSAASYPAGQPVVYQNALYLALAAVAAGVWNPAQWTQLTPQAASAFTTGDAKITLKTVADTGWLMMNDGTIGSASSGSTHANADAQNLFNLLFANINDANAPLFTSTGTSTTRSVQGTAAAAWTANCRMSLTKQLGRALAVSGAGSGLSSRLLGDIPGTETNVQNLNTMVTHSHYCPQSINFAAYPGSGFGLASGTGTTFNGYTATATTGGGLSSSIMQPSAFWNVMIKL